MKKISIITLLIGVVLIFIALMLTTSKKEIMPELKIEKLKLSNISLKTDNSFDFDIYNDNDIDIKNLKVNLFGLNESNEIIMISEFNIENLKAKETKKFEYSQLNVFEAIPTKIYFKEYNKNEQMTNVAIESQFTEYLKKIAREVIVQEYGLSNKKLNVVITASDLKDKYNKDLGDLTNDKYKCSLLNSYVEIVWNNETNEYDYIVTIDCQSFYENLPESKEINGNNQE